MRSYSVAAPGPVSRISRHPRPYRIQYDIASQVQEINCPFPPGWLYNAPKGRARCALPGAVELLRIDAIELSHTTAEIAPGRLDHDVVVVCHQTIGVAAPIKSFAGFAEKAQPVFSGHRYQDRSPHGDRRGR